MRQVALTVASLALAMTSCNAGTDTGENNKSPNETAEANQVGPAEPVLYYTGLCEASAAVDIGGSRFAAVSDEDGSISIYQRGNPRRLERVPGSDVSDLEAAARAGDLIYWLTSHSFNRSGEDKARRKFLFASRISGSTVVPAGDRFAGLRTLVARALGDSENGLGPDLNIEGLASTPDGGLILALREPLNGGKARLVRITNPQSLIGLGGPAASASALPVLDLEGRGIRSLERVGSGDRAYLILAGPVQDAPGPFALYWWDGESGAVTKIREFGLDNASPEALIAWSASDIQVIGDNGDACEEDDPEEQRRFPSIDIRL